MSQQAKALAGAIGTVVVLVAALFGLEIDTQTESIIVLVIGTALNYGLVYFTPNKPKPTQPVA